MTLYHMPARPGAHTVYAEGENLVAEWYDFGDHAPYESANMLILDPNAQRALALAMVESAGSSAGDLAAAVAKRFQSWFEFKDYLAIHGIEAVRKTDFWP